MKGFFTLLLVVASMTLLSGQGGAQIFGGLASIHNTNPNITKEGQIQSGYTIGIQSRLKDGTFVAGPGLKYTRISMMSFDEPRFFNKEENYHIIAMPMNIGLEYRLTHMLKLRMYTGGDLNYVWKIDDNDHEINFDYINDYFFGAHAGLGIDVYWITFDINYEYGLTNAHQMGDSKYNILTFNAGFFF